MVNKLFQVVLLIFCSTVLAACSQDYDELVNNVETTNLVNEQLKNIKLGSLKKDLKKQGFKYGEDNPSYISQRDYDRYLGEEIFIDLNRESKKVVGVLTNDEINFENVRTYKGIKINDDIQNVKKLYGGNYYTYSDEEQGLEEVGYVDKKNNIQLAFTANEKGKIIGIRLSVYIQ